MTALTAVMWCLLVVTSVSWTSAKVCIGWFRTANSDIPPCSPSSLVHRSCISPRIHVPLRPPALGRVPCEARFHVRAKERLADTSELISSEVTTKLPISPQIQNPSVRPCCQSRFRSGLEADLGLAYYRTCGLSLCRPAEKE